MILPLLLTSLILSPRCVAILVDPAVGCATWRITAMMAPPSLQLCDVPDRRPPLLLFLLYGFIHVFLLIPVRIRALLTLTDNRWGTRTAVQRTS